jgi:integrase
MELFGGVKDTTRKLYMHNLKKLNDDKEIKDLKFLKKIESILEKINQKPKNTGRSYLIAIVSALKNKDDKLYAKYYPYLEQINAELKTNTTKSEKQEENWLSQDIIMEKQKQYMAFLPKKSKKELTEAEYNALLDLVVLSLYTLTPPRRSIDYISMLVSAETSNPNFNYYNNGVFLFNNYKTNKVYKSQIEAVPKELNDILKVYLKFKPKNDHLLCYYDGTPLNHSNQITRILNRIFGNKISVNMLRNIFISDKFSPAIKDMEDVAQAMGTSVNMLQNTYAKQD